MSLRYTGTYHSTITHDETGTNYSNSVECATPAPFSGIGNTCIHLKIQNTRYRGKIQAEYTKLGLGLGY